MGVRKTINKHRNWAINAMKENENARNNDWDLLLTALENQGVYFSELQKSHIKHCGINYHTLLRERQKIQSDGELLPTNPEILEKRRLLAADYAEHYSQF